MEDDGGYMALSPWPHNEIYTKYLEAWKTNSGIHTSSRRYKITVGILGACCVILGSGVIVLTLLVFQCRYYKEEKVTASNTSVCEGGNQIGRRPECSLSFEDAITHLKHTLCESPTEISECKLCPRKWESNKGKCYWFSGETKNWLEAYDYCSKRNAQLIVFQDLEETKFIQNITQVHYRFWIGLNFTSTSKKWTWIDGLMLNQTLFPISLPKEGHRCAVLKVDQILSEMCTDQFKWICKKDAVLISHTALKRGML